MFDNTKGIYALEIVVTESTNLAIGSLRANKYEGAYLYIGSAHGPGGFQRVARHLQIASGAKTGGHWHIDHLLEIGDVQGVWLLPTQQDLECKLARRLARSLVQPVEGFGSSDCDCYSHLFSYSDQQASEIVTIMVSFSSIRPVHFDLTSAILTRSMKRSG